MLLVRPGGEDLQVFGHVGGLQEIPEHLLWWGGKDHRPLVDRVAHPVDPLVVALWVRSSTDGSAE
jgi:hypothetical protein